MTKLFKTNWHLFKTTIIDVTDKFVPSKIIKPNKDVPRINRFIKRKMRLRNKIYVRAKRTQSGSDWSAYRTVRNEVNKLMKEAYHNLYTFI